MNRRRSRLGIRDDGWPPREADDAFADDGFGREIPQRPRRHPPEVFIAPSRGGDRPQQSPVAEWSCIKCANKNFNERPSCFKCGTTRYDSEEMDAKGYAMVGLSPSNTLLIRELPSTATEDAIRMALTRYSGIPVQRVQIAVSRRYALARVKSEKDADYMLQCFHKMVPHVDNCAVIVTYSKQPLQNVEVAESAGGHGGGQPAVSTPFGQLPIHATPDPKAFQLEPCSGYYFDRETGFYYDAKTDYYFNPETSQWMFWCSKYSAYINCEGGDIELKRELQEDERDFQFRQKQRDERGGGTTTRGGRGGVQIVGGDAAAGGGGGSRPTSSHRMPANKESSMEANMRELFRQNQKCIDGLREQMAHTDQHSAAKIQEQLDLLTGQYAAIKAASLTALGQPSSTGTQPQFKRDIVKPIRRPPSVVDLLEDDEEAVEDWRRQSSKIQKDDHSWRRRTAFDDHIEQAERAKIEQQRRSNQLAIDNIGRVLSTSATGIEEQIRQAVDRRFQEDWQRGGTNDGKNRRRSSSSVEREDRQRQRRRSRSPSPRGRSSRHRRPDSRKHNRSSTSPKRSRHHRLSVSPIPAGREPMAISPPPPAIDPMIMMAMMEGGRGGQGPMGMGGMPQQGLPFMPAPPVFSASVPGGTLTMGIANRMYTTPGLPPMMSPQIGLPLIPARMPAWMPPAQKQFFPSNDDHWRIAAQQQTRYPITMPMTPNRPPGLAILPGALSQSPVNSSSTSASTTQLCTKCGCFGHHHSHCPMGENRQNFDELVGLKKRAVVEKERNKLLGLNICFNCGRPGHNQFGCRYPRISDDELQRRLRNGEEKMRRRELEKQQLKRKAEKYPVRRKDRFIQRLREVAPRGKITKELIRTVCTRCAGLNHDWRECARVEAPRSIHKDMCRALEEFTKIFFVHLNDDNLVDFSQKFDTFSVMDAIERGGTIDPVGLQLQSRCKDGIVTQGELRELCSKCANLGHKQQDCPERESCGRSHYEKMLTLVKGYRGLVKEGNGNFLLPTAKHQRNKQQQERPSTIPAVAIEEIVLLDSSDEEDGQGEEEAKVDGGEEQQANNEEENKNGEDATKNGAENADDGHEKDENEEDEITFLS